MNKNLPQDIRDSYSHHDRTSAGAKQLLTIIGLMLGCGILFLYLMRFLW